MFLLAVDLATVSNAIACIVHYCKQVMFWNDVLWVVYWKYLSS